MKELVFALSGFAGGVVVSYLYGSKVLADSKASYDKLLLDAKKGILATAQIPSDVKLEILSLIGKL